MTTPIGEEFIKIRPDATGFRAELQAQVAGALAGVQQQTRAAQTAVLAGGEARTRSGLIVPAGTQNATRATAALGAASKATNAEQEKLSNTNRRVDGSARNLTREIEDAERATGRFARGTLAATAASTGFFRAVSFASGAFLIGATLGASIAAAVEEFRNAQITGARTAAIIKATGESANVTAEQIDKLARTQQDLTGVNENTIKSGADILLTFRKIRNEVGAGNDVFNRSVKAAQDISTVFGTSLTTTSVQLGKALQDPVKGVTALRRSGITLTQSQRDLINHLVETGRVLTAQKIILSEVEQEVGGTARAIGQTLPGKLDILKEKAKVDLGEFVARLQESRRASEVAGQAQQGLQQTFGALKNVVKTLGPPLLSIAQALDRVVQTLGGVGAILAAVAAYKALTFVVGAAATAQAFFRKQTLLGIGAITQEEAALLASTGAFKAETLAQLSGTTSKIGGTRVAIGELGAASTRTGAAVGALRGIVGSFGTGLAITAGITALTVGFIKLKQASDNLPGSFKRTQAALNDLNTSITRGQKLTSELAGARENVSVARFNVQAAQRDVNRAQARVNASPAQPGSLEQRALADQLTVANNRLDEANRKLVQAEANRDRLEGQFAANQRSRKAVVENTTAALKKQIDAFINGSHVFRLNVFGTKVPIGFNPVKTFDTHSIDQFIDRMKKLAASGNPIRRQVGLALEDIASTLREIPDKKQIDLVLRLVGQGASLTQIRAALGIEAGTEGIRARGLQEAQATSATLQDQFRGAQAILATDKARLKVLQDTTDATDKQLKAAGITRKEGLAQTQQALAQQHDVVASARDAVAAARDAKASALDTLTSATQALADAVTNARRAVTSAVQSAKTNLGDLTSSIATDIDNLNQKLGGDQGTGGKLGARFRALRDQIIKGGGGPETQRAAQQVAFTLQNQQGQTNTKSVQTKLADLTDQFSRGQITLKQFNTQFNKIVKGINIDAFRKNFGTAATNLLLDQIKAVRQQARLIAQAPRRAGGTQAVNLVRPALAVAQGTKDIANATKDLTRAQLGVARANRELAAAERRLRAAQTKEQQLNTAAIKANTRVHQQEVKILGDIARERNAKPKPKGNEARNAGALTNAGASPP